MSCRVCGSENSTKHFGGISCRACAAFFRRYVTSPKTRIVCSCKNQSEKSYPCRHCRMLKCIEIGMTDTKVQKPREKTSKSTYKPGQMAPISLLSCNIIPKTCYNITFTLYNWPDVDEKRKFLYGDCIYELSFYELSNFSKMDAELLWNLGELIFQDLKSLSETDKHALICNFFPRWILLESSIDYGTNNDFHTHLIKSGEVDKWITHFYGSSMSKENRLKDEEILKIFKPYWKYFYDEVAHPIYEKKFDRVECIALFLLLLFDDGYTNISEDSARLCRSLRKVILRELKGYQMDNDCSEARFLNVISTLMLLEKGEEKFQEEVLICGLNNVSLHDDFKTIMQVRKL